MTTTDAQPDQFDLRSLDVADARRAELLHLFPEARTEGGKLDFDRLRAALGETIDAGRERYGMTWPGKADTFQTIQASSVATLLPCPEESVKFETTENMIIEGDNLEVLKLLQKSYLGKVKMIYIDPPYNTGKDFIYPDNYSESLQTYLEYTGQVDDEGRKFGTNPDTDGRFHSKWLNMMYPRLYLARNLLREDGVIFVSIDDHEVQNLMRLCDEVFGEENFLAVLPTVMNLKGNNDEFGFAGTHEYTIVFARDRAMAALNEFRLTDEEADDWEEDEFGPFKQGANLKATGNNAPREKRPNLFFPLYVGADDSVRTSRASKQDIEVTPITDGKQMSWRWSKTRFENAPHDVIVSRSGSSVALYKKQRPSLGDMPSKKPKTLWYKPEYSSGNGTNEVRGLLGEKLTEAAPKPLALIRDVITVGLGTDGVVLDFFAGSGTTAHAVLDLNHEDGGNRNFILVQLPEPTERDDYPTIAEITKERVRRVIAKLQTEAEGQLDLTGVKPDYGFRVFKLAESNFTPWDADAPADAASLNQQIGMHVDHVREARSDLDLLYEVILKAGLPLTLPVETLTLAGKTVYRLPGIDGPLLVCLERDLTIDLMRAIAKESPRQVVCLDEGFAGNDQLKANAVQTFKTRGGVKFETI